ncbi:MAG: VCBS repeat-containing protein [Bacteroidales bacterium]|nr:VCBS repeat-containing protein [Bacteroidales bacterium]
MSHTVRLKDLFARRSPRTNSPASHRVRPELVTLESREVPATAIWTGKGSSANWSDPANWQANVAPTPNVDDLLFPAGAARTTNNNDFAAGTKFVAIQAEAPYTFGGLAIEITGVNSSGYAFQADLSSGAVTVNLPNITFSGPNPIIRAEQTGTNILFSNSSKITIGPSAGKLIISSEATVNNRIEIRGPITGTGDLVKIDPGRLVLAPAGPSLNNSYTGTTYINEGDLQLSGTGTSVTAIPGNIVIGDNNVNTGTATLLQTTNDQIADTAIVTVQGDGIYNLGTQTERVGGVIIGSSIGGGQIIGTGKLELAGDVTVTGNPSVGSKIATNITLVNPNTTFNVPESINNVGGPDLLLTGAIDGPANLNLVFIGGGRSEMQAINTGGYSTIVNDGVLILNKDAKAGGGGTIPGKLFIGDSLGFPGSAEVRIQESNSIADTSVVSIESDGILTSTINLGTDKIAALISTSTDAQVNLGIFTLQIAPASDFVYNGSVSGDGRIQIVAPGLGQPGRQTFAGPMSLTGVLDQFSLSNAGGAILEVNGPVTGGGGGLTTTAKGAIDKLYSSSISTRIQTFAGDIFYPGTYTTGGPATTQDLTSDGKFVSRINSTSVFGSLAVTGLVNSLGELRVELPTTMYRPSVGEVFKILDIVDPSVRLAFNGITFTGLPEGARFFDSTGTVEFEITYAGGDGNDVLIINTGAPSVRVRRAGDQPATTSATSAAFTALFSAPVQPIIPPGVRVTTTGTVTYESVQIQQQNDSTFRITVLGLAGEGTVAVSLDQGAAFSLAGTPSQPSLSINDENVVIVTTGGGGGTPPPIVPPGGTTGGLGFFSGLPGSRTLVGSGVGGGGLVNVYQGSSTPNGQLRMTGSSFSNGVRVASADFNFDGVQDYLLGSGPGGVTSVQLLDGRTGAVLFNVQPFESEFTGGVFVSVGDVTKDGRPDIVVSPDEGGGPRVQIYRGGDFAKIADFFGIDDPLFQGGARTTVGDINGDGFADVVVAAGFGGGPRISVYSGKALASGQITHLLSDFFAFEPSLRNGTFVAVSDINGDGFGDLITGAGPGGAPRVTTYDGKALSAGGPVPGLVVISNFYAGPETNRGGVPLGLSDFDGDGTVDLLTGTGVGEGSRVRVYPTSGLSQAFPPLITEFDAFPGSTGGVFVG